jgi:hypothetical protein
MGAQPQHTESQSTRSPREQSTAIPDQLSTSLPPTATILPGRVAPLHPPEPPTPPTSPSPTDTLEGPTAPRAFGRYQLLEGIARGGMGVVYRAWDSALDRVVALKMIRSGLLAGPEEVARFQREARAAAGLNHPHIVQVHDVGEEEGHHYFTMTFAPGGSLARRREEVAGDPRLAVAVVEKVARAVQHAHANGILHRDLKPGNVLLDEHDEPLVSDFGLAKILDEGVDLTRDGQQVGTPAYMAPEQASGHNERGGPWTDVWSLGVILYELLTGQRPFSGTSQHEVTQQILSSDPPSPRTLANRLDPALEVLILKCLEKDPARRFGSAAELADELARWLRDEPILTRPEPWYRRLGRRLRRHPTMVTVTVLGLVYAGVLAVLLYGRGPQQPPDPEEERQRELGRIEAELSKGMKVTLLGASGQPRSGLHFLTGGKRKMVVTEKGQPFELGSFDDYSMLELLPAGPLALLPPGGYRLNAKVQHHTSHRPAGLVGLYFLHQEVLTPQGKIHAFAAMTFSDVADHAAVLKTQPKGTVPDEYLRLGNPVGIGMCVYPETVAGINQRSGLIETHFQPTGLTPPRGKERAWYSLAVEVTPETVRAFWEGQLFGELSLARLQHLLHALFNGKGKAPVVLRKMSPHLGLGLIVYSGAARFRNVEITPLNP